MSPTQTLNARHMRLANRAAVLELIRVKGPIAQSVIGRQLGMSPPTVMRIIEGLTKEALVCHTGDTEVSGGRRRELLAYQGDKHLVIGVDLGGSKMYGALANIGGSILHEANADGHATSGEACFERLASLIEQLINIPLRNDQRLRGIAIGAPGITHLRDGTVERAPSLNWEGFPLRKRLEERFRFPVVVENDVNLAALGENWFGVGQGVRNMVLVAIGTGVGSGIIIDGALYRGHSEAAGEIGYMVPGRDELNRRYDSFGALESIISGTGIADRAKKDQAGKVPDELLESLTAQDVFDSARRGEKWAARLVDEEVDYLSISIASIATLLDPEMIVLGGGVSRSADLLISALMKRLEGVIPRVPRIEVSLLGSKATVMGAIALMVYLTDQVYQVRAPS